MSAEVVSLAGDYTPAERNEVIIKRLKNFLSFAEKGELVSVFIAANKPNGAVTYSWTYNGTPAYGDFYGLIGAVTMAKDRLMHADEDQLEREKVPPPPEAG